MPSAPLLLRDEPFHMIQKALSRLVQQATLEKHIFDPTLADGAAARRIYGMFTPIAH
jgi:hypothetical protein